MMDAVCELLWALRLILHGKIESRIKRKPKFTEPEAAVGTLLCVHACQACGGSAALENGLDHASLAEQMRPCRRHGEGFQAEGDG